MSTKQNLNKSTNAENPQSKSQSFFENPLEEGRKSNIIPLRTKKPFLPADFVIDSEIATITESPYIVPAEQSRFKKEQTVLPIKLKRDNQTYRLSLNASSNDRLVKAFSHNGDNWINKEIVLQKRTLTIQDRQKDVIFVSTVDAIEDSL